VSTLNVSSTLTDPIYDSHKIQEATLFILKQVLDEFRTYDRVMDREPAGMFLDHVRASMQDRKSWPIHPLKLFYLRCTSLT